MRIFVAATLAVALVFALSWFDEHVPLVADVALGLIIGSWSGFIVDRLTREGHRL